MKENLLDLIGEVIEMSDGADDDNDMHQDMHEGGDYRRMEVITGRRRRRAWTAKEKATIVAASSEPGINISDVTRRFGVNRGLPSVWRRQVGLTAWSVADVDFVPIAMSAPELIDTAIHALGSANGARAIGRIELELDGARLVMTGSVDPALAGTAVAALLRRRCFRRGMNGLVAHVASALEADPYCGDVFVFRPKRGDRLRLVFWYGSGMVLTTKRLEAGKFVWPPIRDGSMRLTREEFALLVAVT